jgi:hypothetical protein
MFGELISDLISDLISALITGCYRKGEGWVVDIAFALDETMSN